MDTCIAGSQRWPGVVLATSHPCVFGCGNQYALTHTSLMAFVARSRTLMPGKYGVAA